MERLRGPINSFFFEEEMSSECMEPGAVTTSSTLEMGFGNLSPQMPFLQMLQGAMQAEEETEEEAEENQLHFKLHQHSQALFTSYPPETNLQLLLRLQDHHHQINRTAEVESCKAVEQLDSCITHASESQSDTKGLGPARAIVGPTERKKRKRSRVPAVTKNAQEVESQRMTHIAVERNRRRLMNDHLIALRSLMPSSFVQRGDQASIIGGAIDFVKELEQLLLSLQAEKRMRAASESTTTMTSSSGSSSCTTLFRSNDEDDASHVATASLSGFFISPQYTSYSEFQRQGARRRGIMAQQTKEEGEEGLGVDVEATVVQGHVNLKVAGRRRAGQLVRAIAAMEELRLSVLHLNITSLDSSSILYSLNLKMEEECKLGSADEIATAMHQIFTYISGR